MCSIKILHIKTHKKKEVKKHDRTGTSKAQEVLMQKYGYIDGEDIFQQACEMAIRKYKEIEKVNQSLFGLLCRWAAREIRKHEKYEVPFSCLIVENQAQTDEVEFEPEDPMWRKDFDAVEEREEIAAQYGQWLLNALLSAAETYKPAKEEEKEEQLQFEFEFA